MSSKYPNVGTSELRQSFGGSAAFFCVPLPQNQEPMTKDELRERSKEELNELILDIMKADKRLCIIENIIEIFMVILLISFCIILRGISQDPERFITIIFLLNAFFLSSIRMLFVIKHQRIKLELRKMQLGFIQTVTSSK